MIKKIQITLLFSICSLGVFSQNTEDLQALADSLIQAGKFEECIPYYDKLIKLDNSNELYYRARGYAYTEIYELDKAEKDLKKAIDFNPDCSNCYNNLGRVEANRGNIEEALRLISLSIEKDPKNDLAFYRRARIHEYIDDQSAALSDYNKAINLRPDIPIYYSERGRYRMGLKYNSLALRDMNKAFELDSSDIQIVYTRAEYFTKIEDWENALKDVDRCIKLEPKNSRFYASKGTILEFMNDHLAAIENYDLAIELNGLDHLTYLNRAISKYNLEDMNGSCEDNRKALELIEKTEENQAAITYLMERLEDLCNTNKKSYFYQRGIAAYNLAQFEDAIAYYDEGLTQFPNSPMISSFRGNANKAMGNDFEAITDYKNFLRYIDGLESEVMETQAIKDNNLYAETYLIGSIATVYGSLAESYANTGNYGTAISYADSAINLLLTYDNQYEVVELLSSNHNIRGIIYNVLGNYKEAKSDFENAISFNPLNALAHANMAFTLINEQNALKYTSIHMGFYANANYIGKKGMTLPVFNKKKISSDNLFQALVACNTAIELDKELAFAYLVRAQIKILLDQPGYCLDALTAKELGIQGAEQQLNVKCN